MHVRTWIPGFDSRTACMFFFRLIMCLRISLPPSGKRNMCENPWFNLTGFTQFVKNGSCSLKGKWDSQALRDMRLHCRWFHRWKNFARPPTHLYTLCERHAGAKRLVQSKSVRGWQEKRKDIQSWSCKKFEKFLNINHTNQRIYIHGNEPTRLQKSCCNAIVWRIANAAGLNGGTVRTTRAIVFLWISWKCTLVFRVVRTSVWECDALIFYNRNVP